MIPGGELIPVTSRNYPWVVSDRHVPVVLLFFVAWSVVVFDDPDCGELLRQFQITGGPTTIFLLDGEERGRVEGLRAPSKIAANIERLTDVANPSG